MLSLVGRMSAIELAKYVVTKCVKDDQPISNLQLQKILYYIQKDYLSRSDLAFSDEIEAWKFGPAVREVYYWFCGFGAMPIRAVYDVSISSADTKKVDPIVEEKRSKSPWDLVEETHKPSGAWAQTFQNGSGNRSVIPIDLIKKAG